MAIDIEKNKNKLIKWIRNYIVSKENASRINEFLAFLENSDFYIAPASTRHHLNCEGGLCQHTLNVIQRMFKDYNKEHSEDEIKKADYKEKVFLVALLHDLCKVNIYKKTIKQKKDKEGNVIEFPVWKENTDFPMGYAEKSLYIAQKYFTLTDEEALSIRWYRGNTEWSIIGEDFRIEEFYSKHPLAFYLRVADQKAKFFDEETISY